ncbi:MAG: DoxX family protein [Flavisolibacter sp.]
MNKSLSIKPFAFPKFRIIAYWLTTAIIVLETAAGAEWDLAQNPFVSTVMHQLGYPLYVLTIIGVWKILAVVALLAPGFPRIKEWAYAGIFFVYSGAAVSHFASGDVAHAWGPFFFTLIEIASWSLRPTSRRLTSMANSSGFDEKNQHESSRGRRIVYWIALVLVEFSMLSAAVTEIIHFSGNVEGIVHQLGYPMYFLTIQGVWKLLAGIAILLPRTPILKEWAYAGIFFSMTGATASNAFCHLGAGHILSPLFIAGLAVLAWALRPAMQWL